MTQDEIIAAVRAGKAELEWVELQPGLSVTRDAVKIAGTRVNVSAATAQRCADLLGASLTTPLLEDMIYAAADAKLQPVLMTPDGSWRQTLAHSVGLDKQLAARLERPRIVATAGKSWVLANGLLDRPGRAANYGMHASDARHSPVSGLVRVWQPLGFAHNIHHYDYSQTLRLAKGKLPTHESILRVTRQPGVPMEISDDTPLVLPMDVIRVKPPAPPSAKRKGDLPGVAFTQAKSYTIAKRQKGDVLWIVLHTAECGEVSSAAENLAAWAAGPQAPKASWHYAIDDNSITQSVLEKDIAWHAPGSNSKGIGIEHAGRARQQASDWADAYSTRVLELSAELVAGICRRWAIPVERVLPTQLRAGLPGICGHVDVSRAFGKSTHYDPGPNFPHERYLEMVRSHLSNGGEVA